MRTDATAAGVSAAEVRELTRAYPSGAGVVQALRGVDLAVPHGTMIALMGPSGSGKTTLLRCLAGLDVPTGGVVRVAGQDLARLNEDARAILRRDHLGMVFQSFELIPYLTAAQNVELPARLGGRTPSAARTAYVLEAVGLGDRAGHFPEQLSGGQQQRVAVARALYLDPALILADEPTGALDSVAARWVLGLLREAVDRQGRTVLMVTHDPLAASYADRVLFLSDGQIVDGLDRPNLDAVSERLGRLEALTAARMERAA